MVTSGGGGTPLLCRNSGDGVTWRRETIIPPSARGGCGARATQPPALGCGGGRVEPDVGFRAQIPPWTAEKEAVPGWDSAHFFGC